MRFHRFLSIVPLVALFACTPDRAASPPIDDPPAAFAKGGVKGQPKTAYALDFTQDFVEVPDASSLDLGASFTLEGWVKPRNANGGDQHVVSKWDGCDDASYSMVIRGGRLLSGIASCEFGTQEVASIGNIVNDEWQHVAITLGDGTLRLYINGVLDQEYTGSLTPINSTRPLSFGHEGPPYNGWWYDGLIDEVRVWNVARSAEDIARNMYRLRGSKAGLVGWWRFDEGTGTLAADASGNGNDGQLGGSPAPVWTTDAAPVK